MIPLHKLHKRALLPLILLLSCLFGEKGWAQDAEFSQFYAAPSYLNPAMIGFSEQPRFALNYRHQYPSFENAYLTLHAAYDQNFDSFNSSVGLSILADRAGNGLLNTYNINGQYAYNLKLSKDLLLKAGIQASFIQQSLGLDQLVFGDMIDPVTGNPISVSTDMPTASSISRFDASLGVVAYTRKLYIGAAVKHITRPDMNFGDSNDAANRLGMRTAFHAGYVFTELDDRLQENPFYFSPNILFVNQNKFYQINAGASMGKGALFGGMWFRHVVGNADAVIVQLGVKAGMMRIGYSYDLSVSKINTNAGAHEASIVIDLGQSWYSDKNRKRKQSYECPAVFN